MRRLLTFVIVLSGPAARADLGAEAAPFFRQYCVQCHGEKVQKADLRLDTLAVDLRDAKAAVVWHDVADALKSGDMPPARQPQPPAAERTRVIDAIDTALRESTDPGGRVAIRRLSHTAMDHTVRDLLGVDAALSDDLPADPVVAGFDNMAETLTVSPDVLFKLRENARRVAALAIPNGPDPRAVRTYPVDRLGVGGRVVRLNGMAAAFSNKNLLFGIWPAGFVAPRAGTYVVRVTALARDNRADFPAEASAFRGDPPNRPTIPADTPRVAAVWAAPAGLIRSAGGESAPGRLLDVFPVTGKLGTREVRVALDAGENVHVSYLTATRATRPPTVKAGGKELPVGEALYVRDIGIDGPLLDSWPPRAAADLLSPAPDARIHRFLERAFRRPVSGETAERYAALYRRGVKTGSTPEQAMRAVVEAVLCSPRFLFLSDGSDGSDAWAVAARLSYFLWNSLPDDELIRAAAAGDLLRSGGVEAQARRMLADPKAARFVVEFAGQWLGLRRIGAMPPDPALFPDYDKVLEKSMRAETEAFVGEILGKNLPLGTFLDSNFAMLNERLARHYGVPNVVGDAIRRVQLPDSAHRGGLLGQASILTITSDGTRTSPVVRGVWVLENLLDAPPAPPPPNVEPLEPDVRGGTTIRQMLEKHRAVAACADCHSRIDAYGFALENFDPVGAWRTAYARPGPAPAGKKARLAPAAAGPSVDASGELADGAKLNGFDSLKRLLLDRQDRFARALAGKLLAHALGHAPTVGEKMAVERIAADHLAGGRGFADLVVAVARSDSFLNRPAPKEGP